MRTGRRRGVRWVLVIASTTILCGSPSARTGSPVPPVTPPHHVLPCADCHPGAVEDPIDRGEVASICGRCHEREREDYEASSHGRDVAAPDSVSPTCISCHGSHDIRSTVLHSAPTSSGMVVYTCAGCHEDPAVVRMTALSDDVVQTYERTFHGLAYTHGMTDVATCVSCHGSHAVLSATDPASLMHPDNRKQVCLGCHPSVTEAMIAQVMPDGGRSVWDYLAGLRVHFPVAGTGVNSLLVISTGAVIGFLSGLFGVGGGLLMTPLLILIGVPAAVAVATNATHLTAGASSNALAQGRLGTVDIRLVAVLTIGGWSGGFLGVHLVRMLRDTGNFDLIVRALYVLLLGALGAAMFVEGARTLRGRMVETEHRPSRLIGWVRTLPLRAAFPRSGIRSSVILLVAAGIVDGLLVAVLGIGGGLFLLPVMIYIIGVPTRIAIGTLSLHIVLTAGCVSLQHALVNRTVDVLLAMVLFAGSVIGVNLGILTSRRLKGEQIRVVLAVALLLVLALVLGPLLGRPDCLIAFAHPGGGR